jgi:hypothetical protein
MKKKQMTKTPAVRSAPISRESTAVKTQNSPSNVEKFIFALPMVHFGTIRQDIRCGAVITHFLDTREMDIDGIKYLDSRDLEICKRATASRPDRPWIVPFNKKNAELYPRNTTPSHGKQRMARLKNMEVINSDTDIIPAMDIDTGKVSTAYNDRNNKRQAASVDADSEVVAGLEVERLPRPVKRVAFLPVVQSNSQEIAMIDGAGKSGSRNPGEADQKYASKRILVDSRTARNNVEPVLPKMKVVKGGESAYSGEGYGPSSSLNAGTKISGKKGVAKAPAAGSARPVQVKAAPAGLKQSRKIK